MADISMKTARFEELWHAWPRSGKKDLSKALQGQVAVLLDEMEDDSAIRLSAAFNRTGHPMPLSTIYSGEEIRDKDGFKYVVEVEDMKRLLVSKLGKPKHMRGETDAMGRRGIILFEGVPSVKDQAGHIDLWRESETADVQGDYWTEAHNIVMWELPAHT